MLRYKKGVPLILDMPNISEEVCDFLEDLHSLQMLWTESETMHHNTKQSSPKPTKFRRKINQPTNNGWTQIIPHY